MAEKTVAGGRAAWPLVAEMAVWLAIIAFMWAYSYQFDRNIRNYAWGAVGWPRGILLIMLLCAVLSFGFELAAQRRGQKLTSVWYSENEEGTDVSTGATLRIVLTFAVPLGYLWLLPRTGYFVTTPLFLVCYMFLLGQRRPRHLIGTTLGIFAVLVLMFSKWLFIPLPTGNWPGFYDISNFILVAIGSG
ncbi:MAG: tripartite tricarboxylate transporter TctB family protein [Alphaproteobacteria bacterium]|nr:tripartite tricarboxylate transporter TctB family protein [Alphaproteobacteria bacterium]